MNKEVIVNDWRKVVSSLKEWYKSYQSYREIYGNAYTEDLEAVYDRELDLMNAIKQWARNNTKVNSMNELSEDEKLIFLEMLEKSKALTIDPTKDKPYSMTFFLPVAAWNDDPRIDEPVMWEKGNILKLFRESISPFIVQRVKTAQQVESQTMGLEIHEVFNYEHVNKLFSEDIDLDTPDSFLVYKNELMHFNREDWLCAGLIPIVLSSDSYMHVVDFNFDSELDESYILSLDNYMDEAMSGFRIVSDVPSSLSDALKSLENLRWEVSTKAIFDSALAEGATYRQCSFTVLKCGDDLVGLEVVMEDKDDEDTVLNNMVLTRRISSQQDYVLSLPHLITDEHFIWDVSYTQIDDEELEELLGSNSHLTADKIASKNEDVFLNDYVPPNTVFH